MTETNPANPALEKIEKPPKTALAVGVQFNPAGKIYTFVTGDNSLKRGEPVMIEAEGGIEFASVIAPPREVSETDLPQNVKKVMRRATTQEREREQEKREKALEFFAICRTKIRERELPMKLVSASIEEAGKKAVFSFFAEQRVDFRALVKELAGHLHMRIEMRQVGARDESKHKGCAGASCGLATCCSLYLRHFEPISIAMAKHQGLSPNPVKLTGMCGKLKCCLSYEDKVYSEYRKDLPKAGTAVLSPGGAGKIIGHNVLKRECTVRLYSGGETRCACSDCKMLTNEERQAAIEAARKAEEAGEERARRGSQRQAERADRNKKFGNRNNKHGK